MLLRADEINWGAKGDIGQWREKKNVEITTLWKGWKYSGQVEELFKEEYGLLIHDDRKERRVYG